MRSIKLHPLDKPWINTKVNKLCRQARHTYFNSKVLNTRDCNPTKWWNNIKALSGFSKPPLPSYLYHDGEFKRGADSDDIPSLNFTKLSTTTIPYEFIITPQQVEHELANIKVHKSAGPDEIPNWLLKVCAPFLSRPICCIFNSSIAQGVLSHIWKCADVIPISKVCYPKSADEDLRPISLTFVLSKILERLYLSLAPFLYSSAYRPISIWKHKELFDKPPARPPYSPLVS